MLTLQLKAKDDTTSLFNHWEVFMQKMKTTMNRFKELENLEEQVHELSTPHSINAKHQ